MTRPTLLVGALAAVCVGMLLWCARLILGADLPLGAHVAAWVLWVVSTAAVVTLLAYLREFLTHREAVGPDASWKPLPSLVLLWVGGLTALLSFAFILPDKSPSDGAEGPARATTSLTTRTVPPGPAPTTTTAAHPSRQASSSTTTSSRSVSSRTAPPVPVATGAARNAPSGTATAPRTSPNATSPTTSTPLIDLHILPPQARPTTPPGR